MEKNLAVIKQELCERFDREFGGRPEQVVTSPGRVNLIGEHTDYNNGYVLPMAIDRYLAIAVKKRPDDLVKIVSTDFEDTIEFSLSSFERGDFSWGEYIIGCMWVLLNSGHELKGFEAVLTGNSTFRVDLAH